MHKRVLNIFLLLLCLFASTLLLSQDTVENNSFKSGEQLKYRVYYSSSIGNLTAGEAILTVKNWKDNYKGVLKDQYRITGVGNSKGMFNWFYKVRDKFETFIDTSTLLPHVFIRKTNEGKFIQNDVVVFDRSRLEAITNHKDSTRIPDDVHDFVSALYYMRTLSVDEFDADSMYYINFFLDDSVYVSAVKFLGRSNVSTKLGTIKCLKIAPMMASGEVFAEKYPMHVWISDDENHVPILAESKVIVGSVKMELIEYEGLVRPLKFHNKKTRNND